MSAAAETRRAQHATLELSPREEQRLRRRVRSWARRSLRLTEREFEDAYQAAWLRAMEHARRDRPIRNLEHFLRWEVANSWKMELRRRQRRPPTVGFDQCPHGALQRAVVRDAAEQLERLEDARFLLEAIGAMGSRRRSVVLLRDAWGLEPAEVCAALGITPRAYRREHARALDELRAKVSG